MKGKRILILFLLFLLCGCTGEYELTISSDSFNEKVIMTSTNSEETETLLNNDWIIDVNFENYNEVEEEIVKHETGNYYNIGKENNALILSYSHNIDTIKKSTAILKCYNKVNVISSSRKLYINTSNHFNCFDKYKSLDKVKITIKTDFNVISNNANYNSGNEYVWEFKKGASNTDINIVMDYNNISSSNKRSNSNINKKHNYSYYVFIAILSLLFVLIYSIYKILKKYSDNNNEI